jgi:aldose 1-epimerase
MFHEQKTNKTEVSISYEPVSGRLLKAYTNETGIQLFNTKNRICLEIQHFPDSANKPKFPSVVLKPGVI